MVRQVRPGGARRCGARHRRKLRRLTGVSVRTGPADGAVAFAPSSDGTQVFVGGSDTTAGSSEFVTIAYSSDTGERLWDAHYQGRGGIDAVNGLAVDPEGALVFVTGHSTGVATEFDVATVAYPA